MTKINKSLQYKGHEITDHDHNHPNHFINGSPRTGSIPSNGSIHWGR